MTSGSVDGECAARISEAAVACGGETELRLPHRAQRGSRVHDELREEGRRVVRRRIVDDHDLQALILAREKGFQADRQARSGVSSDDDRDDTG